MINFLKNLLSAAPKEDFKALVKNGARIIDVRTRQEYAGGSVKGSINIPLDSLRNNLKAVGDKDTPIITCCASGMRSASAKSVLSSLGYTKVYNGGGWKSLNSMLE